MNVDFDVPTLNAAARRLAGQQSRKDGWPEGLSDFGLYDMGKVPVPVLRVFHRDGCTGLIVDQFGNEPF